MLAPISATVAFLAGLMASTVNQTTAGTLSCVTDAESATIAILQSAVAQVEALQEHTMATQKNLKAAVATYVSARALFLAALNV